MRRRRVRPGLMSPTQTQTQHQHMKEIQQFVIVAVLVKESGEGRVITRTDIDNLAGDNPLGTGFAGLDFKVEIRETSPHGNAVTRLGHRSVLVRNWLSVESGEPTAEILEALRAGSSACARFPVPRRRVDARLERALCVARGLLALLELSLVRHRAQLAACPRRRVWCPGGASQHPSAHP